MSTPAGAAVVAFPSEYERELAEVRARNAAALAAMKRAKEEQQARAALEKSKKKKKKNKGRGGPEANGGARGRGDGGRGGSGRGGGGRGGGGGGANSGGRGGKNGQKSIRDPRGVSVRDAEMVAQSSLAGSPATTTTTVSTTSAAATSNSTDAGTTRVETSPAVVLPSPSPPHRQLGGVVDGASESLATPDGAGPAQTPSRNVVAAYLDGEATATASLASESTPSSRPHGNSSDAGSDVATHDPKKEWGVISPGSCGNVEPLTPPKRKRGKNKTVMSPLPVQVARGGRRQLPDRCHGLFMHCGVWVTNDEQMRSLFSQGCFGKGYLSRSGPERIAKTKKSRAKRAAERDAKRSNGATVVQDRKRKRNDDDEDRDVDAWFDARGDGDDMVVDDSSAWAAAAADGDRGRANGDISNGQSKALKVETDAGDIVSIAVGSSSQEGTASNPGTGAVPEYLQLSFVEAFFLVYALSALTVFDEKGEEMSVGACWKAFRQFDASFAVRYAAYHHLRSLGWVPKSGVKFGVDFLAYRKGPEFYHSSYSVMVRAVDSVTLEPVPADGCNTRVVTWATLANLNRLSSQVGKELVVCSVLVPQDMAVREWDTPACLTRLSVQHTLMRRWIPEKTRYAGSGTEGGSGAPARSDRDAE